MTAIDHDSAKIERARRRWHRARGLRFEHAEAASHLSSLAEPVDVVCSIFGALSFTPAGLLLNEIAGCLEPGGRLAIAARTPGQATRPVNDHTTAWEPHARTAGAWSRLLAASRLSVIASQVLAHPVDSDAAGCVVLIASHDGSG